jgi:hypothetical protein
MLVLGIGKTTFGIAKVFERYPEYKVKYISPKTTLSEPEEYEKSFLAKNFNYLKKYNTPKEEILVLVSGGDLFSAIILKLLELVQNAKITVLFLKANLEKARKKNKLHQRVVMGVLQEYARSGLFKEILLVDELKIKSILLDNVSILDFQEKSSELIASSFHMMNVLKNQISIFGSFSEAEETEKICTFGLVDLETKKENLMFQINRVTSKFYLFYLNKTKIEQDTGLLNKIDSIINDNATGVCISHSVYPSNFENNYVYIVARTSDIQET